MSNMKLVAYSNDTFSTKVAGGEYELMLNPDKLRWERRNQYNEETGLGSMTSPRYSKTQSEKLIFEIVIDCTGVVDSTRTDLPTEIAKLSKVVYTYNGSIHRPNYVIVNWGSGLAFKSVLTTFDLSYTFFKPDGTPLRAKISLAFSSYLDPVTMAKMEGKQSPDMSHLVNIVDGDDLPNISEKIYGSTQYYVQIAQFNQLNKFRHLRSGSTIVVPPLIAGGTS